MTDLSRTNGASTPSPILEYHPGPPQATAEPLEPPESSASPRKKVASQIRAFQALADESDIDWDQPSWDELVQLMDMEEIFHNSTTDPNGDIVMSVDILLDDIADLYHVDPAEQVWSKSQIRELMGVLKERGRTVFFTRFVSEYQIPIPKLLLAFNISLCPELRLMSSRTLLYFLNLAMGRALATRDRLTQYNTIQDAANLIQTSKNILILTGAGISVSCGIPDFRSRDGLYASLSEYELDDPQQMFDISYFRDKPSGTCLIVTFGYLIANIPTVFYSFASKIYPSNFIPSPCHRFIKLIEDKDKLLRNYTQNIDTLETLTGVKKVIQCHGSFATASCIACQRHVPGSEIEVDIMRHKVPVCRVCHPSSASPKKKKKKTSKKKAKGQWDSDVSDDSDGPDFPTEKLSDLFEKSLEQDREQVDLLLVIGTSLKVSPVADMISHIPHSIPQILINKTPIRHINPDIVLLGNADTIITHLCSELGWELPPPPEPTAPNNNRIQAPRLNIKKRPSTGPPDAEAPERVGDSHVWLFEGAEGGRWLRELEDDLESRGQPPPKKFLPGTPGARRKVDPHYISVLSPRDTRICSRILWLLRESADTVGLPIRPDGFVPVSAVLSFNSLAPEQLNLDYLKLLIERHPLSHLELKEELSVDRRFRNWLIRVKGWTRIPGVAHNSRRITVDDLPDIPFRHLMIPVPLQSWKVIRRDGIRARAPFLVLEKELPEHREEQGVAVILNVKTCLQLGVTFWIHPNGSIRTNGDASGHIDPQLFESAHLIEWERETLMSDGEPSLLLAKPTSKPSFRDRDSTPRPGRMAERSPFVEKLSAKLSEAKHVQAESPNIGASQDRIFGRLQSTQVSAPPHLANGDQPPSFVPKITAKG
ncbi:DHS-like NAD/FAD-binding domain-containing protein [Mucidula mucida]|nr:DHS-like NAD/FAD-binding domain-containing protein [Mucidula mucida]